MPQSSAWTDAQDSQIKRLRAEGATWERIAVALSCSVDVARERGRRIRARRPPPDFIPPPEDPAREPLPAGDIRTWGLITRDTVLEGDAYPLPMFPR